MTFSRRRGIYLISALFVTVVLVMTLGAAVTLVHGNGANSDNDGALLAADSGLRYVQARLGENYAWRGNANAVTVSSTDLTVQEDNGNVVGIIRCAGGEYAQFRVRFNYQDGSGSSSADGLPDPVSLHIDNPYVSINNVLGGSAFAVPRGDGPNNSVTSSSATPYSVPAASACVLVEGRAGAGLRDLSPNNLNPATSSFQHVTTRVVEAYLRASNVAGSDAVIQAAGSLTTDLGTGNGNIQVTSKVNNVPPRVRSKADISVTGGSSTKNYQSDKGEAYSRTGLLNAHYDPTKTTPKTENPNAGFYQLGWSDVHKATSSDPKVAAGTYVLWDDGTLHYYNLAYSDYVTHIQTTPTDAGSTVTLPANMTLDVSNPAKPALTITSNIFVDASSSVTSEFNLIPRGGAQEDPPGASASPSSSPTSQTLSQQASALAGTLGAPAYTGSGVPQGTGGPSAAAWNIPISGTLSGTITVSGGNWNSGTWYGVNITSTGAGTARLTVDDGYQPGLTTPSIASNPAQALNNALAKRIAAGDPNVGPLLAAINGASAPAVVTPEMNFLNLGAVTTSLLADDLKVQFKPPGGQSAILSADGAVRLGANVQGQGGSITSGDMIRIVGAGTNLAASQKNGLNLYAKGDLVLSSLQQAAHNGQWTYKDFQLKGVAYTWASFYAKIGNDNPIVNQWGNFQLEGALVAYGGNPSGAPGSGSGGAVNITSKGASLNFDSAYLTSLKSVPAPGPLSQTLYNLY